jgi:hypothetical protein
MKTGTTPMRFLEVFRSSYFANVSLHKWFAPGASRGALKSSCGGNGDADRGKTLSELDTKRMLPCAKSCENF